MFDDNNSAVVCAVEALAGLVVGRSLEEIVSDLRGFYRLLTSDGQMRWVRASWKTDLKTNLSGLHQFIEAPDSLIKYVKPC